MVERAGYQPPPETISNETPEIGLEGLSFNEAEAQRLGLERLEIKGNVPAQQLIEQVIAGTIDIETSDGRRQFMALWNARCPDLPAPCVPDQHAWWYLTQLKYHSIIANLDGTAQSVFPHFDVDKVLLVDDWTETDYNAPDAATKHTSQLIKALLGQASTVNIKRADLDAALWQGDPALRVPTKKHKALLKKLGVDPAQCHFRLIAQDEYARLALSKAWGQHNLMTQFDHYYIGLYGFSAGVAHRSLYGGSVFSGGPSSVNNNSRSLAASLLAVRLVLARKPD